MPISITDFWNQAIASGLFTAEQCQQLKTSFGQVKGAVQQGNARTLAEWMISRNLLTRYQVMILLAGHAGPFFYGDYKLVDRYDEGPAVGAFRAEHVPTGHPVMLEFLAGRAIQDAQFWSVLSGNLQRLSQIDCPYLQRCYEVVDLTTYRFVATELVTDQSAAQLLASGNRLPVPQACGLARCAALALAPLHERQLAHGDVRPARLCLERGGIARLLVGAGSGSTPVEAGHPDQMSTLTARADYLAPEFLQSGKTPDTLTDIYALGCMLYELLSGRPPFEAGDMAQKLQMHASQAIQPLEPLGVPESLTQTVAYMMAKNPAVRFQNVSQVIAELTPLVDPAQLPMPVRESPPTWPSYQRMLKQRSSVVPGGPASVSPLSRPGVLPTATALPDNTAQQLGTRVKPVGVSSLAANPTATPTASSTSAPVSSVASDRFNRRRSAKKKQTVIIGASFGAGAILVLLLLIWAGGSGDDVLKNPTDGGETVDNRPLASPSTGNLTDRGEDTGDQPAPGAGGDRFVAVQDDGQQLWMPPTTGEAIDLRYVPPGSELFLIARPAQLSAQDEGQRVLQAMGPSFEQARLAWENTLGVPLAEADQLIFSLHDHGGPLPVPSMVVRLRPSVDPDSLLGRLGNPSPSDFEGSTYYRGRNGWTFYLPPGEAGLVVMGDEADVREVIQSRGAPPVLRLAMEKLLRASDQERQLTILFSPNALIANLFRDGRSWSFCEPSAVREPLDWFLGDGIEAGMLSAHFADQTFVELSLVGRLGRQKSALATELRERLRQMPERVERHMVALNPAPYGRMVAARYPQMLRYLYSQTRVGSEGDFAVLNAVLPESAAHNLVFASEMALAGIPSGGAASTSPRPAVATPATIEKLLEQRMTIAFGQDSLEFAKQSIESEVRDSFPALPFPFAIKILGSDLELNGITRNQQIRDFDERNKTIAEILTAMVLKANPIKTVQSPDEEDQQLIWVIGPNPDNPGRNIVLVTTRAAAAKKGYRLPSVFRSK